MTTIDDFAQDAGEWEPILRKSFNGMVLHPNTSDTYYEHRHEAERIIQYLRLYRKPETFRFYKNVYEEILSLG